MSKSEFQREIDALSISVINNFDDVVEEYSEQNEEIDGHRFGKKFFRINCECFPKLLEELTSSDDCSYITYANAIIKDGFVPKKLSCLYKQLRFDTYNSDETVAEELVVNEVLSSQILNYFGVPTVYNSACALKNEKAKKEYGLLSIDFLNGDSEFETLEDLGYKIPSGEIRFLKQNENFADEDDRLRDNFDDFITSVLVRLFVLHDGDFRNFNIGNISNLENGKNQLINFDFEFTFDDIMPDGTSNFIGRMASTLESLKKNYHDIYTSFLDKCMSLQRGINKISARNIKPINKYHKDIVFNRLKRNLKLIQEAVKKIEYTM